MKKVLFINEVNPGSMIPQMLASSGYNIVSTNSTEDRLDRLESGEYGLIILLENAAAESWVTCTAIRRLTPAPLIVISPGATAESCVKTIMSGADFFLRKPFGPMELISRINALLLRLPARQPVPVNL
jgi:DNA-binding response OmpR family regulator